MKCYHPKHNKVYEVQSASDDESTITCVVMTIKGSTDAPEYVTDTFKRETVLMLKPSPCKDNEDNPLIEGDLVSYGDGLVCEGMVTFDQGEHQWLVWETLGYNGAYTGEKYNLTKAPKRLVHKNGNKYIRMTV